jgi:hypothetical protein
MTTPMTDLQKQWQIPDSAELNLPGGTYTATLTALQIDKEGQWFATSMSSYAIPSKRFAIHLWYRKHMTADWMLIQYYDGAHGTLFVIGNDLVFVVNRTNGTSFMNKIKRWQGARS